jgi:mannosyl-oligosaccharide alpha-1,3-glucosidase
MFDVYVFLIIADVGGFFGNPEPEMLVRWYQVGILSPFFRAHAHIDTKRREPFLLDQPYKGLVKDLIRLRYTLLPMWYTAFRETSVSGVPILKYGPTFLLNDVS